MGYAVTVPMSMVELGSPISGTTNTIIAAGVTFDFPLLYIPLYLKDRVERAFIQLNIPYVYNSAGADNWITSFLCEVSPDAGAHSYTAIDETAANTFRCQNGATSSLTQWLGSIDISQYVQDAIEYGILMSLAPNFHVSITATSNANSIAWMLHSCVLKVYLNG